MGTPDTGSVIKNTESASTCTDNGIKRSNEVSPRIIYINGVHTRYAEGLRQAEVIEKFSGRHVFLFHNPSATWTSSLVESLWNRWLWWLRPAPIVRRLAQFLERSLSENVSPSNFSGEKCSSSGELDEFAGNGTLRKKSRYSMKDKSVRELHILAHSQGTAIANNAVNLLPHEMRKRIRMTLFAPVNSFTVQGVNRVDRFINKHDYVVSNLFLGNALSKAIQKWQDARRLSKGLLPLYRGITFTRNARGHSFLKGYFNAIKKFESYKVSMFWKLKKEQSELANE